MADLFDPELRALRRDRASRSGPELFLYERAFDDCLDRLAIIGQRFGRMLLIGCPDPGWRCRLEAFADTVEMRDPGPLFAAAAAGSVIREDRWEPEPQTYDLVLAIGTFDTVNDLPRALMALRLALKPTAMIIGAFSGGDTLPVLRAAMRAADLVTGGASPHVHPRIEASALAPLLARCGFVNPVVDVDRARVSYGSFHKLVRDLRRMGTTNVLAQRSRTQLSRMATAAASASFTAAGDGNQTIEIFEILHFAAWAPPAPSQPKVDNRH